MYRTISTSLAVLGLSLFASSFAGAAAKAKPAACCVAKSVCCAKGAAGCCDAKKAPDCCKVAKDCCKKTDAACCAAKTPKK